MDALQQHRRRVHRVRHKLKRRELTVARVAPLGSELVRVVFAGESLADFVSLGFDDHVKFMLEGAGAEPVRRDYTPRRFDAARGELTIDFALHGDGAASDWARQAAPGQRAVVGGPRGSMIVPLDYAWHLLAGDATAVPAISRRLEELPAGAIATVVAQVSDASVLREVASAARVDLRVVADGDALEQAVRDWTFPPGEGFVWCAGEASTMARLRDIVLVDKRHPREAARIAAYWRRGAADFHEDLANPG